MNTSSLTYAFFIAFLLGLVVGQTLCGGLLG